MQVGSMNEGSSRDQLMHHLLRSVYQRLRSAVSVQQEDQLLVFLLGLGFGVLLTFSMLRGVLLPS
jgi:uncharacterized membrane protein